MKNTSGKLSRNFSELGTHDNLGRCLLEHELTYLHSQTITLFEDIRQFKLIKNTQSRWYVPLHLCDNDTV